MGNSSPNQNIEAYVHPRLGPIKRIKEQQSIQYIQYCVGVESEKIIQQWQSDFKSLKNMGANQFLFLPLSFAFDKTAMCGTGGNIDIKFQDYMFSLAPEIKTRSDIKRPFREEEIWYLLYSLANIGSILQKHDMRIGDVRPDNILLNQDGQFKLISSHSWPGNPDSNQLIMQDPSARVLLSPEQCQFHNKKKGLAYPDGLDFNACQTFSMGITVLEAGTLKDCYDGLYERSSKDWRFNEFKVRDFTDIISDRYSKELTMIIQEMLKTSPERRIRCSTIIDALAPYKNHISSIEPFELDRAALWEVIEAASKDRAARFPGKSSLSVASSTFQDHQLKNSHSFKQEHQEKTDVPAFGQISPRNKEPNAKTNQMYSSYLNPGVQNQVSTNGMLFSFQNPHQMVIQQNHQQYHSSIQNPASMVQPNYIPPGQPQLQPMYIHQQIPVYPQQTTIYHQPGDSVISHLPSTQYQSYTLRTEFPPTNRTMYQTMEPETNRINQPLNPQGGNPMAFGKRTQN